MRKITKTTLSLMVAVSLAVSGTSSWSRAASGGTSGGGRSSSSNSSSSFSRAPSSNYSSGTSGVSRPDTMSRIRQSQAPAAPAAPAAPVPQRTYGALGSTQGGAQGGTQPAPAPKKGYSTGALVGAAAVAGVAGYALGNSGNSSSGQQYQPQYQSQPQPQYQQPYQQQYQAPPSPQPYQGQAPSITPVNPGMGYAGQPAYAPANQGSSFPFGTLLFLALLAAGGFYAYRRFGPGSETARSEGGSNGSLTSKGLELGYGKSLGAASSSAATSTAAASTTTPQDLDLRALETNLLSVAPGVFTQIQKAYSDASIEKLSLLAGPELLDFFKESLAKESQEGSHSITEVLSVRVQGNKVWDLEKTEKGHIATVVFEATISENHGAGESIIEAWHFERGSGATAVWKAAGIEAV